MVLTGLSQIVSVNDKLIGFLGMLIAFVKVEN